MLRSVRIGIVVSGALLVARAMPTRAQEAVVEGPGYEVSEGTVIHPSVTLETGFISNVFYEDVSPAAAAVVRLIGGFRIASQNAKPPGELEASVAEEAEAEGEETPEPAPSKVDFRLGGQVILLGYLSSQDQVRDQSDVAGSLDGHVVVNPAGNVSFSADDTFVRDARPRNFESFGNLNRDFNHLQLGLMYRPGGRAMGFGLRYENTIDRFEGGEGLTPQSNRMNHLLAARAEWQWLPVTKFFFDTSLGFFGALGDSSFKTSSMPLRIRLGVGTALSEITTLRAHVGYANGFYSAGPSFNMAVGGAEFGYRYTEYGRVRLIAEYDYYDSLQANYYRDLAFLARVDHQFGLLMAGVEGGVRLRGYRGIPMALSGGESRDDILLNAAARVHYLYRDWLALLVRFEAVTDQTDYRYDAMPGVDDPSFTRLEAYAGVAAAF